MKPIQTFVLITCMLFLCAVPTMDLNARDVISTEYGDVFVITYKEYADRKKNGIACSRLPPVIKQKAFQTAENQNFTASEYERLAGDAPYLGLRSPNDWYSKSKRKVVSWDDLYNVYGSSYDGNWDHLPMLCGVKTAQSKRKRASANPVISWKNGDKSCSGEFCELAGGAYLHAIYTNNVELIKKFDASVDNTVQRKLGAILSLSKDLGENPQDFSLLPALANAYLAERTSEVAGSCGNDVVRKTMTRKTATYDMFDADGLYEGQGGGEVYRFTYVVKPGLVPLCDSVCDSRGGRSERSALRMLNHGGANLTLNGIEALVDKRSCSSAEIVRFENNLASLTGRYLAQKYQWRERPAAVAPAPVAQPSEKDTAAEQLALAAANREEGARFRTAQRAQNNVAETSSGLQYTILAMGEGRHPRPTDQITIMGVGNLIDGRRMDDSYAAAPKTVAMQSLLPGLSEGLQLIKPGGKVRLILPPELGFGDRQLGMIEPGSTLIYELELVSIVQ